MLHFEDVNWLAVLAATAAGFLLGGLWYGPLFGKAWMAAVGKTEEELRAVGSAKPMGISLVAQLVTAIFLAGFFAAIGVEGWHNGLHTGLLLFLALVATAMASDYAFCGWGLKLWLIQSGYRLAYGAIMGAILAGWR